MKALRKRLTIPKLRLWVYGFGLALILILASASSSLTKDSAKGAATQNGQKKNSLVHLGTGVLAVSSASSSASGGGTAVAGESGASATAPADDVSAPPVNSAYIPPPLPPAAASSPTPQAAQPLDVPVPEPLPVINPPIDKCLSIERPDGGGNRIDDNRCVIYCPDSCGRCGGWYRPEIYLCVAPY